MLRMRKANRITIHCSDTEDGNGKDFDAIKRYHVNTLGWDDIGYHYVIEKVNGEYVIQKGRETLYQGAHVRGHNSDNIGICLVGKFDDKEPDGLAYQVLAHLIWELLIVHKLDWNDIYGHGYFDKDKTCPGRKFNWARLFCFLKARIL